jgi:hypothetical protein
MVTALHRADFELNTCVFIDWRSKSCSFLLQTQPVTAVRQCITSQTRAFVIATYPTIKNPFCKIRAVDIPLSVLLNACTICRNTRSAIHGAQAVLLQHTAPLRLTEINGQGMNLEQRMNERRSYVTDFLLQRTARNMKHVVAQLQCTYIICSPNIFVTRQHPAVAATNQRRGTYVAIMLATVHFLKCGLFRP